jgi:hypothetical protein
MVELSARKAIVRTQGTVVLDRFAAPQPDIALLRPKEDRSPIFNTIVYSSIPTPPETCIRPCVNSTRAIPPRLGSCPPAESPSIFCCRRISR